MKKILFLIIALLIGFLQPFRTNGQCKIITASTDNIRPQISGNTIVWEGIDNVSGVRHIYKYDGTAVMQVSTSASTNNINPQIDGNTIVWQGTSGGVWHIFKFDGTSVMQVSTTSIGNTLPQISGNTIVWQGVSGGVAHILKYDGTSVMQVSTTASTNNINPQIDGNTIVWLGTFGGLGGHVFKYDGTSVMRVTALGFNTNLQIDGNTLVWIRDSKIYKFDGTSITQVSTVSTSSNFFPQIDGNTIVWYGVDIVSGIQQIFKSDGTTITQVSNSVTSSNSNPQIDGNTIVWEGIVGGVRHIFKSDGTTVTQVSNSGTENRDPKVSGNTVVWYGNDGTTNQIYFQSPTSPTIAAGLATSPSICGAADGSIAFTSTNLPDGTYSLSFTATLGATTSPQNVLITGNTFTLTGLKEGTYSNFLITNNSCTTSDATSKTLNNPTTTPSVSISPTAVCVGTSPTLSASATNGGSSPQFYWTKNNEPQGISDFSNKTQAVNGLGSNSVQDVYVDNAGIIYAATYGGGLSISTNGGTSFTNKTTANGLGANIVYGVYVDNDGTIYAATQGGLSISTNGGTSFSNKTDANGLGDILVFGVYVDKNGTIYAATDGGLSISTNGGTSFINKTTTNGLGNNQVNGVYVDNAGTIYAGTQGGLSISTNGGTSFTNKTTANGLGFNTVYDVYVDYAGVIYAATFGGLSISTDGGASFSNKPLGNIVRGVYVDNAGTIYVATQGSGVHISTDGGTSFINKTTANGLAVNVLYGIHVGNDGTIYAATAGGLGIASQASGNSLAVTNAVAGDVYKVRLVPSADACPSPATAMASVTILTTPTVPITSNLTICSGSTASLSASCASGTVNWYDSNSSTLLATTASFTTPNLTTATTYQVRCESGSCTSGFVAVNVSTNPVTAPTGTSNSMICSGSTASLSASCASGTVNWYDSNSSTLLATTASFTTPNLTTATTYQVRCESGSCTSRFVAVNVNINPVATATQEMIWTGRVSTNWNDACNWSPNGVPTATNPVTILNVANDPVIMSGTTAYAFTIAVGNAASLTINSGGELNVLPMNSLSGINLISNSIFTNNGLLSFTPTSTLTLITVNDNATFNNNGTANLNSSSHSITMGGPNAMVNNSATGIINLQGGRGILCINGTTGNVITNQGTINYTGSDYFASLNPGFTLNNSGTIDIRSGSGIAVQGGTLNNLACAKLLMSGRAYDNQYSSVTINDGLMVTGNINTTNGSFTNNGILRYSRLVGGTIDNRWLIVNNENTSIFTYGSAFNGTVNGIFTDATATTSAGTFTAPNTLVLPCTVTGSRAYYAKVTTSDGTCTYIVPFNYAQPTFGGRAILLQPSCAGGTGNIDLTVSNLPICTPTVTLTFTATGVGATTSPQTVGVHSSAGGRYSLEVNFKAGTYSNFTITHNGYTVTDSRSYTLNEGAPLPTITTTATPPICAGATSFTIPYTATTGSPTVYSISGTGITSVTNRTLPASPITVNLNAPASGSSIDYTLTVNTLSCNSVPVQGSVTVEAAIVATASNSGPYLIGNTIELNATGGNSYSWTGPNSFTSSIQNPIISNGQSVNSGIYSATITSGGCTATATTNVVVNGINPCDLIVEYQLVKAGNPYQPLFNLTNGMNINQLTDEVSILVVPVCPTVQIESFNMNIQGTNLNYTITQNVSPYSVFDNIGTSVFGRVLPAGTYTLTVTGYSQDNLQGNILYSKVLTFTILPNSASINMPTLSRSSICGGSNLDITLSLSNTYNPSNQFNVELSDANGEFESDIILGNTSNIGTYIQPIIIGTSNSAGTINCSIPSSVAGGTNYRIRVISTDGVSVSPISTALTIHPKDLNLASPTNDINTNIGTKQASQTITATNKVNSTANVIYQAGKSITLNTGFEAKAGTVFQAQIGGCGNN